MKKRLRKKLRIKEFYDPEFHAIKAMSKEIARWVDREIINSFSDLPKITRVDNGNKTT